MIRIDIPMPSSCDECFALDDHGDCPYCLISHDQRGYTFDTRANRMPSCPLIDDGMIKKLEPRVIGLSEIEEGEGYWMTTMSSDFIPRPVICVHNEKDARKPYITLAWQYGTFSWKAETYGTEWHLWSAKPIGREWMEALDKPRTEHIDCVRGEPL